MSSASGSASGSASAPSAAASVARGRLTPSHPAPPATRRDPGAAPVPPEANFFDAFDGGTLGASRAISLLRSLRTWARALDEVSRALGDDADVLAARARLARVVAGLEHDLADLDPSPEVVLFDVELRSLAAAEDFTFASRARPAPAAAALNAFLDRLERFSPAPRLAAALGLPADDPASFLAHPPASGGGASSGHEAPPREEAGSKAEARRAAERAIGTGIVDILVGLASHVAPAAQLAARELNCEAGSHVVARDPRELEAALRAGVESWNAWPYYERRYGARGRQFTRSDSGWLVSLADESPAVAKRQVDWLARVLANRGMPVLLLEQHLARLHGALVELLPDRAEHYANLRAIASELAEARRAVLTDEDLSALSAGFDQEVGPELAGAVPNAGMLLGAALVDKHAGIPGSLTSFTRWLSAEPQSADPRWARAIERTLREAEARAERRGR